VILGNLPGDSAYMTAVRESLTDEQLLAEPVGPIRHGRWSRADFLLARAGDLLAYLIWMQSAGESPPPDPLPRPGVKSNVIPINADARAYLERVREMKGAAPHGR